MPLSANEFVLPGFGGNPGDALTGLSNKLWMRNMQTERLKIAQEGKREQSGKFLQEWLSPEHYLSGTAYDPVTTSSLGNIMQRLSGMAEQGADIPTLLQAGGPDVAKLSEYTQKAKVVKTQLENGIKQMRESGVKGVDFEKVYNRAQRLAFHDVDPTTGKESLKNPAGVDPGTDYLQQAIQEHPDEVMNGGDIQAYAKAIPVQKTLADIKQYDAGGGLNSNRVHFVAPKTFVPEVDAQGVTTGMVPRHEIFTDGGKPVMHPFTGPDGKTVQAPVRMLDENDFDAMTQEKPLIANYLMGEVKKHWPQYEGAKPYDPHSPEAKRVARAFAYDEINRGTGGNIENAAVQDKPGAQQVMMHMYGGLEQRAYDRAYGAAEGKYDAGVDGLIPGKANTVDAMIQIARNNPDFLHGAPQEVNGHAVMDVSSQLPKSQLKYGPGRFDAYTHVYYDPKERTFTLEKTNLKDPKTPLYETVDPKALPELLHRVAQPNNVPGGSPTATKSLTKFGYNNGNFPDVGEAPDLSKSLADERSSTVSQGLDAYQKNGEKKVPPSLQGIPTPAGKITSIDTKWFGDKYNVGFTDKTGKVTHKRFPTREAMEAYFNTSSLSKSTPDSGSDIAPEKKKQLDSLYMK